MGADVAKLADAPDLESGGQPCRFKSCHPHQNQKPLYIAVILTQYVVVFSFRHNSGTKIKKSCLICEPCFARRHCMQTIKMQCIRKRKAEKFSEKFGVKTLTLQKECSTINIARRAESFNNRIVDRRTRSRSCVVEKISGAPDLKLFLSRAHLFSVFRVFRAQIIYL